ncbi:diacylglycerol kinase family protein [Alkalihalobacillus deserti]|uniref:diacylglycerol kinase family protein n=1 Tax=Alkalihalobacillus deserti TaxID=2879466 RepID=UPI0027E20E2E|nr:diacylglycerol kinase family protein [Alkalihalobacillus deserti]
MFATQGLIFVVKHEQNMQIHLIIAGVTLVSAYLLSLPLVQWMILLLVIAGMFSLEIMNTAVERTVDLITEEFHPLAKRAKDIAAAAVFVYCIFAVIIGVILFVPALIKLL